MIRKDIIIKSFTRDIDHTENKWLEQWLAESEENRDAYIKLKEIHTLETMRDQSLSTYEAALLKQVSQSIKNKIRGRKRRTLTVKFAAAAAVISFIILYGIDFIKEPLPYANQAVVEKKKVITTERIQHRAILVHQNQEIALNSDMPEVELGSISVDNNSQQNRVKLTALTSNALHTQPQETKIIVPRGCRYSVALPDSSVVWLNAESQLSFPAEFNGNERIVTLIGEAYFNVTKDKKRPFIVKFNKDKQVEVLGTRFNIRSYDDEKNNSITLNHGSVKVISQKGSIVIAPKECIDILPDSTMRRYKVNNEDYMSWINGYIQYRNIEINTILNDLSRRYNIDFTFSQDDLKHMKMTILLTKEVVLDELITALNRAGENIFKVHIDNDSTEVIISKI